MNRVILCLGEYAETPYYFDKVYVNLYSIEELCYVLYENAFLLDKDVVNIKLVEWIDKELKLTDLARELYTMVTHNVNPEAFVGKILEYTGYYSKADIDKVVSILRMNVTMNVYEKKKAKADFLYENRHFLLAIREYMRLVKVLPEDDIDLLSKVYNNMGVAYMALYLYDSAAQCFLKAYETNNNEEAYMHYVTVKRLELSDEDYIRLVTDEESTYKMSIQLETIMEKVKAEFDESDEKTRLDELFALRDRKDAALYYEEISGLADRLKEDYRDIVLDSDRADINSETVL